MLILLAGVGNHAPKDAVTNGRDILKMLWSCPFMCNLSSHRAGESDDFHDELEARIQRLHKKGRRPRFVVIFDEDGEEISGPIRIPQAILDSSPPLRGGVDSGDNIPAAPSVSEDTEVSRPALVEDVRTAFETTATDDAILEVLKTCNKPMKLAAIAKRARMNSNSYFGERLKILCDVGRVLHLPGHLYWLAARGEPFPG